MKRKSTLKAQPRSMSAGPDPTKSGVVAKIIGRTLDVPKNVGWA
jgi:hypothetical protein